MTMEIMSARRSARGSAKTFAALKAFISGKKEPGLLEFNFS